jgi:2-polyprenyl-3-methyl-5-hydroxy-6-metoxy-1,4-benzoquinol methylase
MKALKLAHYNKVERIELTEVPLHWYIEHKCRYEFAKPFCHGKRVLDAGCGVGYVSEILAETSQFVNTIDIDSNSIEKARGDHWRKNVFY